MWTIINISYLCDYHKAEVFKSSRDIKKKIGPFAFIN